MTPLADWFLWCALQVTFVAVLAVGMHMVASRFSWPIGLTIILAGFAAIVLLTVTGAIPPTQWSWHSTVRAPATTPPTPSVGKAIQIKGNGEGVPNPELTIGTPDTSTSGSIPAHAVETPTQEIRSELPVSHVTPIDIATFAGLMLTTIGLARLLRAAWSLHRYRRTSQPIRDRAISGVVSTLTQKLDIRRRVDVRESHDVPSPATIGWRQPLVLLPTGWNAWTRDERSAVLAHELAHVRLAHFPQWLFGQCALALHFYHPLVHSLATRLRLEQELAADDYASRILDDRPGYAAALASLALRQNVSTSSRPGPGLFLSQSLFMRRIEMLRKPIASVRKNPLALRLLVTLCVVAAAVAISGIRAPATAADRDQDKTEAPLVYPYPGAPESTARRLTNEEQEEAGPLVTQTLKIRHNGQEIDIERVVSDSELQELLREFVPEEQRERIEEALGASVFETREDLQKTHVIKALYRVSRHQPSLLRDGLPVDDREWTIFCRTQVSLIKSEFILTDALRDPEINQLPIVRSRRDAAAWLAQKLAVYFLTDSEILTFEMTCNEKEVDQYRQLVDAVARAYEEHVVFANRKQQYHKRDVMMKTLAKLQDEIRRKMEDFHDLAKEIGSAEHAGDAAVMQQLAMRRLARIEDELMRLENEMIQLEVELELRGKGPDKDLRLRRDALSKRLAQLTERREQLTDDLTTRGETSVDLTVRRQELDQLSAVASDMARRIEALDIDMDAPQRITKIQPATASQIGK